MSDQYLAGGLAMFGMCVVARHTPLWVALPVTIFIWYAAAKLSGAYA